MDRLYENIRTRRKELKMTQQELAEKIGYSDRSSIAKIESGGVDLSQSKIMQIAKALEITPGELMGDVEYTDVLADEQRQQQQQQYPSTIAAHLEQDGFTQDEIDDIENYMEFVKARRKQ